MKDFIMLSNCLENIPGTKAYLSTFIDLNRVTLEIVRVSYHFHESYGCPKYKLFNNYDDVLNEIKLLTNK